MRTSEEMYTEALEARIEKLESAFAAYTSIELEVEDRDNYFIQTELLDSESDEDTEVFAIYGSGKEMRAVGNKKDHSLKVSVDIICKGHIEENALEIDINELSLSEQLALLAGEDIPYEWDGCNNDCNWISIHPEE